MAGLCQLKYYAGTICQCTDHFHLTNWAQWKYFGHPQPCLTPAHHWASFGKPFNSSFSPKKHQLNLYNIRGNAKEGSNHQGVKHKMSLKRRSRRIGATAALTCPGDMVYTESEDLECEALITESEKQFLSISMTAISTERKLSLAVIVWHLFFHYNLTCFGPGISL